MTWIALALFVCLAGLLWIWGAAERELARMTRCVETLTVDLKATVEQRDQLLHDMADKLLGSPTGSGLVRCYDQFGQIVIIPFEDLPVTARVQ